MAKWHNLIWFTNKFNVHVSGLWWRATPPSPPSQQTPSLLLTPSTQLILSKDSQTMPRGSRSLIFLKIPLSSPLLKNVWKADTKLEKRSGGKKRRGAHLGVRVVTLLGRRQNAEWRLQLGIGCLCRDLASWLIKLFCCSNIQMAKEIKGNGSVYGCVCVGGC